jgi:hypothetical protein
LAVPLAEFQSAWGFSVVPGYPGLANHTTHVPGNVKKRCKNTLPEPWKRGGHDRVQSWDARNAPRKSARHHARHTPRRNEKALPSAATDDKAQNQD